MIRARVLDLVGCVRSPVRKALVLLAGTLLLAAVAAGGWALWSRRQAEREDLRIGALKAKLEARGGGAEEHHRLGLYMAEREGKTEGLAELEIAAEMAPDSLRFGNDVRIWCVHFRQYDRNIRFFERLTEKHADLPEPRLQLALAYVDKMPDHMMGIVGQGRLSNLSIAELTRVLETPGGLKNEETRWSALYALGLNHLYWPKAMRHAPAAVEAFQRCIELQKTMRPSAEPAYFVLPYVGLGDAYVKEGRHADARPVWKEARERFPDEPRLRERLALDDDRRLTEYIDRFRGLGVVVDTDLAILWGRKP